MKRQITFFLSNAKNYIKTVLLCVGLLLSSDFNQIFSQNTFIAGPTEVCSNEEYTFEVINPAIGASYDWSSFGWIGYASFGFETISQTATRITLRITTVTSPGSETKEFPMRIRAMNPVMSSFLILKELIWVPKFQDMIIFPSETCYSNPANKDRLPYYVRYVDRYVCLGDTAILKFGSYNDEKETILPTEFFYPERVNYSNGTIIDHDDFSATMVWDNEGESRMLFKTSNRLECFTTLGVDVIVRPKTAIPIISDTEAEQPLIVCKGQQIHLGSDGPDGAVLKWQISDGRIFISKDIEFSIDQPGTYIVELIEETVCACSLPTYKTIIVEEGDTAGIECTGTICQGEEVTYFSSHFCDTYQWAVSGGGVIVDGGGPGDHYITVVWNTSPTGTISLFTPGCFAEPCEEAVSVDIPIIGDGIEIEGKELVCFGSRSTYTVPFFDGTTYNWYVPFSQGTIVSGQGTNSIYIAWKSPNLSNSVSTIQVQYENCYVDCEGFDNHDVTILPALNLYYDNNVQCVGNEFRGVAYNNLTPDWSVEDPNGIISTFSNINNVEFTLLTVGTYSIECNSAPGITCNDSFGFTITVASDPEPPANIVESNPVCQNISSEYSISGLGFSEIVHWSVYDGDLSVPIVIIKTKKLTYEWTTLGPFQIEAYIENTATGCIGAATIFILENISELTGTDLICQNEVGSYHISAYEGDPTSWTINPSNAGEIINYTYDSLYVLWTMPGMHEVNANNCNAASLISVEVAEEINLTLSYGPKCPESNEQLTGIVPVGVDVQVLNDMEEVVSTSIPTDLLPGIYTVLASNSAGCAYSKEIEIIALGVVKVRVSSPQPNVYCLPPPPITIVVDTDGTYTFEWFRNNVALGETGTSISTTEFGTYHVIVTDSNGCTSKSNTHLIRQDCGTATPIDFSLVNLNCNNLIFEVDAPYNSTTFTWFFDDPDSAPNNVVSGLSVMHEFTYAGYYYVIVNGNENEAGAEIIEIGTVADFEFSSGCSNTPIQFDNTSTYIPGFDDSNYNWDFGDASSGVSNVSIDKNPIHTYTTAGSYVVTLATIDKFGCLSTREKTIVISAPAIPNIIGRDKICINSVVHFNLDLVNDDYSYLWNFDDPVSGSKNESLEPNVIHIFQNSGSYSINLTIRDIDGCISEVQKTVTVVENDLLGDITGDIPLPKCPDDVITLTAPPGGESYIWSTGQQTQSISVSEDRIYSVTMFDDAGCEYTTDPFRVTSIDLYGSRIYGQKRNPKVGQPSTYLDSIYVCKGEEFDLLTNKIFDAAYLWSTGGTDVGLFYDSIFSALSVGIYDYTLEVIDNNSGCKVERDYKVIILEVPDKPSIETNQGNNCEGKLHILSVTNQRPNTIYVWQDGSKGLSYETRIAGQYYVEAINEDGCGTKSEIITISPLPSSIGWMTGCIEVCFPSELCLTLNENFTYELWKDDVFLNNIGSSATEFNFSSPGDYHLVVSNSSGCDISTDILSLTSITKDQTLSGIVYFDENMNGVFDGIDNLLEGVIVYLLSGNTVLATIDTDADGFYDFGDFPGLNHKVEIDLSGLDFSFEGLTDSLIIFDTCFEDKEVNFPLTSNCFIAITRIDTLICSGELFFIDGIEFAIGETDTLRYNITENCDSIVIVEVQEAVVEEVVILPSATCIDEDSGSLLVLPFGNYKYSIDNEAISSMQTYYENLAVGSHTLYIFNERGCVMPIPFEIPEALIPEVVVSTEKTCVNAANGNVEIEIIQGEDLMFSLDNINYINQLNFDNLSEGNYILNIQDGEGCFYEVPLDIEAYDSPSYLVDKSNSCQGQSTGQIEIIIDNGSPDVEFSLGNQLNWTTNTLFTDLNPGAYVLFSNSEFGCVDSTMITIESSDSPMIDIVLDEECENATSGSINITSSDSDLQFSLDGINYTSDYFIDDIAAGTYILYYLNSDQCEYQSPFEIMFIPEPEVVLSTSTTCLQNANGVLTISVISGNNLEYSIDGIDFQSDLSFSNLPSGIGELYIKNALGCIYTESFEVNQLPSPDILLVTSATCQGESDGSLNLEILQGDNLSYSLNGIDFGSDILYDNLDIGAYNLTVIDAIGCTYLYPFEIIAFDSPNFNIDILGACREDELGILSFDVMSPFTVEFSIDNQFEWSSEVNYSELSIGLHTIYSLSEYGCIESTIVDIPLIQQPEVVTNFSKACENINFGSIDLAGSDVGLSFSLDGVNFDQNYAFDDLLAGSYILYYLTQGNCLFELLFEIEQLPLPIVELISKPSCEGESNGSISIISAGNNLLFSIDGINFNSETSFLNMAEGEYTFSIQNEQGCIYDNFIEIESSPMPEFDVKVTNSCLNENSGSIVILSKNVSNKYSLNGSPLSTSIEYNNLSAGVYSVQMLDSIGCKNEMEITIKIFPELSVEAPILDLDCYTEEVEIALNIKSEASPVKYSWSNGSEENSISVRSSGLYEVTVADICDEEHFLWDLEVSTLIDDSYFYRSNIFSPNNDGVNDCFEIVLDPSVSSIAQSLLIFDRWGSLVFDSNVGEKCWDGKLKGRDVVPGVYVYISEIMIDQCEGVKSYKKMGDVTVIR